ncbi:MAG: SDR family NAD(P)-dependent oxidoreductase [Burkholderiales bacterium]|nr:SDR family NAD(P)-dependent oxidoreductase [Burkholderiales bacterium]
MLRPLNPSLPPWREMRAWIVGASSGIGAAVARALLERGAHVALSARSADRLREAAGAYLAQGTAVLEPLDFTDGTAVAGAWKRVAGRFGHVDLVLIVAGTHQEIRAWELTDRDARALLETNLHGPIGTVAAIVPGLLAQGRGAIGIVSSLAGYRGLPKALVYGASKAALINFAETLYLDLRPRNVGVYLINPGFVKTPLTDRNRFRMPHLIGADEAARAILAGLRRGDFEIAFPRAFARQLALLRHLPYRLYFAAVRRATGL